MSERKVFWLNFIGGITRLLGILLLLFTAYLAIGIWGLGDQRGILPLLFTLSVSLSIYCLGKKLESVHKRVNYRETLTNNKMPRSSRARHFY